MVNIYVLIKQVPRLKDLQIEPSTGTIIRESDKNVINPDDHYALELGLQLREKYGGKVVAVTMGPPQAEFALKEAIAMGVDDAILISDQIFAYSDTLQTTLVLRDAFQKCIQDHDLIITGSRTSDSSTGQVPYQLSEALDIPIITHIFTMEIDGNKFKCQRNFGHESQNIEVEMPVMIRIIPHYNEPRHVSLLGIKQAFEKDIQIIDFNALNCPDEIDGCNKSPTKVIKTVKIEHDRKHEFIEGKTGEKLDQLIALMKEHGIEKLWTGHED